MKNYKKPISALLKTASLALMQGTDKMIYSGLTNIIGEANPQSGCKKYDADDASTYQALQSTFVNLAHMLFSDDNKSVLEQSLIASLTINFAIVTIATIDSFTAVEHSASELFKFGVSAAVNAAILGSIDWGLNYLIPDSTSEEDDYNII